MEPKYIVTPESVTRELEVSGSVNTDTREPVQFMQMLGTRVPFDTGLMPPGLRSYSQAGDHSQMVFEMPPGINMVNWGERERDPNCKVYKLAQPYRVIVASFLKGNLLGARMFYSPYPIASKDQVLYHQNVPNINCQGYNETGIGWVCLYHTEDWSQLSVAERAAKIIERCSGVEAYNNRNMRMTDGTRFYAQNDKPKYVSDPVAWEKKTEAEGHEWTLDPDLWIECKVANQDSQLQHDPNGVPLTLGMVMDGMAPMYYRDRYQPKPDVALRRDDLTVDQNKLFTDVVTDAFNTSTPIENAKVAKKKVVAKKATIAKKVDKEISSCFHCGKISYAKDLVATTGYGNVCGKCLPNYKACPSCAGIHFVDDMYIHNGLYYCGGCYEKIETATAVAAETDWGFAVTPNPAGLITTCTGCGGTLPTSEASLVKNPVSGTTITLCAGCMDSLMFCGSCGTLEKKTKMVTTKTMVISCTSCAAICAGCGYIYLKTDMEDGKCSICNGKN